MKGRLASLSTQSNMGFSPFVDVAVNAMAAMFIFLVVYIAAVPPQARPSLQFTNAALAPATWHNRYQSGVSVVGGTGAYHFQISADSGVDLAELGFAVDEMNGMIRGVPQPKLPEDRSDTQLIPIRISVTDADDQRAEIHTMLTINPVAIPFDPKMHALRFAEPDRSKHVLPVAWDQQRYEADIAILGGIEAYEYRADGLPNGLKLEGSRIIGTPSLGNDKAPRSWTVHVTVTDQQGEYLSPQLAERYIIRRDYVLSVSPWRPFRVESQLPRGHSGQPYAGAMIASGGTGNHRWTALVPSELEELGLTLDPDTGVLTSSRLHGDLSRVTSRVLHFRVDRLEAGELVSQVVEAPISVLPPLHLSAPPKP